MSIVQLLSVFFIINYCTDIRRVGLMISFCDFIIKLLYNSNKQKKQTKSHFSFVQQQNKINPFSFDNNINQCRLKTVTHHIRADDGIRRIVYQRTHSHTFGANRLIRTKKTSVRRTLKFV